MTMFTAGGFSSFQNLGDLPRAMRVRVLREDALQRGVADAARAIGVERAHELPDFGAVARDEHFFARLEKEIDPFPRVGDEARAGAGGFEDARGGGPAVRRPAVAADVEYRARRAVERVVIAGEHVADVVDGPRHPLVFPAGAAEKKTAVGEKQGRADKKLFDARFAIRKPIAEEGEIGLELFFRRHGMVRGRIERVVDGDALPRAERLVLVHDRRAAAVGEDQVVTRNERAKRIGEIVRDAFERGGRIDVPEDGDLIRRPLLDDRSFEQLIKYADAARFDDDVEIARGVERARNAVQSFTGVDNHARPLGIFGHVAMLLTAVRVGLEESDLVAERGKVADDAAVVSRRAVPVRRNEAAAEEGDLHHRLCSASCSWGTPTISSN